MAKMCTTLALIAIFAMIGSYFVSPNLAQVEAASKKLKVTVPTKTVAVNTSITLKTNAKAKFKSSNKKIATVSSKGVVKGKKAGKVTITVTSKSNKNQKKTVKITVKNQLVITAPDGAKATLQIGETTKIKTNLTSTYVSSDANIAEVSSSGIVTAKSAGTATITVTSKKYKKLKKTVTITVTNQEEATTEESMQTSTESTTSDMKPGGNDSTTQAITAKDPNPETPSTEATTSTTENPSTEATTETPTTTEEPIDETLYLDVQTKGITPNSYAVGMYDIIVYLASKDGTKKLLEPDQYEVDYIKEVEEDGKKYLEHIVTYKDLEQIIKVETIDLPDKLIYVT